MAAKKKNSLVANINRRKKAGKSRPKRKSTVSKASYKEMQKGWPKSAAKKKKAASKKRKGAGTKKKGAAKKRTTRKRSTKKRS